MNQLTKNKTKGLTVMEVVIVLLILAILAAISIPALTGYAGDTADRSRVKETEVLAEAAESAVRKVYKLGMSIDGINSNSKAAQNLRTKALKAAGVSGKIVSFHVSDGSNYKQGTPGLNNNANPAPYALNFTEAGTLEFLEYADSDDNWFGQYRLLGNSESQVRTVTSPDNSHNVSVQ